MLESHAVVAYPCHERRHGIGQVMAADGRPYYCRIAHRRLVGWRCDL